MTKYGQHRNISSLVTEVESFVSMSIMPSGIKSFEEENQTLSKLEEKYQSCVDQEPYLDAEVLIHDASAEDETRDSDGTTSEDQFVEMSRPTTLPAMAQIQHHDLIDQSSKIKKRICMWSEEDPEPPVGVLWVLSNNVRIPYTRHKTLANSNVDASSGCKGHENKPSRWIFQPNTWRLGTIRSE